ncbi:MAG: serine/threonine-protein kinase, partial [Pseudonocardiales bacterium]
PAGYRFVRILGSGGAGWVALAEHEVLHRMVAIKTIFGGASDPQSRQRLEREGQALARLVHPCVVRVYELVEVAGDAVLVMEYVTGADLSTHLRARSLSAPALVRVLSDVADALAYAAQHGVVHRDVKPANVLVTTDGRGKVADFGIARLSSASTAFRTAQGIAQGTPMYASPEQMLDPDHESAAADAYSFAVMVYQAYLGDAPFKGDTPAMLMAQHVMASPVEPRQVRPELDDATSRLLLAGLAKDPAGRPSPVALMHALAGSAVLPAMAGQGDNLVGPLASPVQAMPWIAAPAVSAPPVRRTVSPVLAGALLAVLVVLVVLLLQR